MELLACSKRSDSGQRCEVKKALKSRGGLGREALLFTSHRSPLSERLEQAMELYTAISRKVVGKNVHATIPKGNVGYNQYTVPDTVAVELTFVPFLQQLANIRPWPLVPFF